MSTKIDVVTSHVSNDPIVISCTTRMGAYSYLRVSSPNGWNTSTASCLYQLFYFGLLVYVIGTGTI